MPTLRPLTGEHYLHKGRIYRVVLASQGTDDIVLEDIEDKSRYQVRFSVFKYAYTRVWKIGEAAQFIGRSPRSIYRYEVSGQIEKPKRYSSFGGRELRFYSKQDIVDMHELIAGIHQGRPRKDRWVVNNSMPTRASLLRMFKERFGE